MTALAPLLAIGLVYGLGVRRCERWPARRSLAFAGGLAMLAVAFVGGLDAAAARSLESHMAQHLLITVVAAPLLVLGGPVQLALRATRGPTRRSLARTLRSGPVRVLAHPATGWAALTVTTLATHLTGVYDLALRHPLVHALEHAAYLWSALLFWLPLAGAAPLPSRPGAVGRLLWILAAMPAMSAVAAWLGDGETVRYETYAAAQGTAGALADQSAGAAVMAVGGTAPLALAAVALAMEALWREERTQRRREAVAG